MIKLTNDGKSLIDNIKETINEKNEKNTEKMMRIIKIQIP